MSIKNGAVILLIAIVLFFGLGAAAGFFYGQQAISPEVKQAIKLEPAIKLITSNAAQSIIISGQVKKIDGQYLTISYANQETVINIATNAGIFSQPTGSVSGLPQQAKFSDIKVGDDVEITLKVFMSGWVQGTAVIILAPLPAV